MKKSLTWLLLFGLVASGCTRRSNAKAQARAAYAAGQQQAMAQMFDAQRTSVRVIGNVRHQEISWSDGLTLAQAIVAAECYDRRDPREIVLIRQRERIPLDPKILLRGDDVPLEPGDTIEIHP